MKIIFTLFFIIIIFYQNIIFAQDNFPHWAKGIVWYQIFPERFANGDTDNDPLPEKVFINSDKISEGWEITEWTSNWFAKSSWEKKLDGNLRDHLYERRYGGDIEGIIDRLDYIENLGIGAIYLNPVFEAVSLHKYDGSTYHHIDVNFGPDPEGDLELIAAEIPDDPSTWIWTEADKLFLKLIEETHNRGMRIIIDGVFNHTGVQFWAFQDIIKNGKNSKYVDWYIVESFDDPSTPENEFEYEGWWNIKSLPEFNRTENDLYPGPKQYIYHSTQRWMDPNHDGDLSDGIDGWRLDVAREVPLGFWKDWNKLVKSINNEAIIIGELWELSPDFISKNGVFDALMNYNFAFAVNKFFIAEKNKIPVSEFIEKLKEIDETYPKEYLHILQNLIGSHDTDRLSSMIVNPDREFDKDASEDNPKYNPRKPYKDEYEKQKLIAAFQMTYRGAPMIYYGDEAGMWGADDPHDRKPMVWDDLVYDDENINASSGFKEGHSKYKVEQNADLLNFYKKVISIRNNSKALQQGDLEFLYSNDKKKVMAFKREYEDDTIIAAFNIGDNSAEFKISFPGNKNFYKELLNGEEGSFSGSKESPAQMIIQIPSKSVKVYKIYSPQ